jgi:hypothetical protein
MVVRGTSFDDGAEMNRHHLKTETESSLRNVVCVFETEDMTKENY